MAARIEDDFMTAEQDGRMIATAGCREHASGICRIEGVACTHAYALTGMFTLVLRGCRWSAKIRG